MGEERSIVLYIILTIITCGLFGLYWLYTLGNDIKELKGSEEPSSPILFVLLSVITCGIFLLYIYYQYPKYIVDIQEAKQKEVNDISTLTLVLGILSYFTSGILHLVNFALIQNELNKLAVPKS